MAPFTVKRLYSLNNPPAKKKQTENPRIADEWLAHQGFISRCISKGRTHEFIVKRLTQKGFPVTISQLKHKLRKWGNRPDADVVVTRRRKPARISKLFGRESQDGSQNGSERQPSHTERSISNSSDRVGIEPMKTLDSNPLGAVDDLWLLDPQLLTSPPPLVKITNQASNLNFESSLTHETTREHPQVESQWEDWDTAQFFDSGLKPLEHDPVKEHDHNDDRLFSDFCINATEESPGLSDADWVDSFLTKRSKSKSSIRTD